MRGSGVSLSLLRTQLLVTRTVLAGKDTFHFLSSGPCSSGPLKRSAVTKPQVRLSVVVSVISVSLRSGISPTTIKVGTEEKSYSFYQFRSTHCTIVGCVEQLPVFVDDIAGTCILSIPTLRHGEDINELPEFVSWLNVQCTHPRHSVYHRLGLST